MTLNSGIFADYLHRINDRSQGPIVKIGLSAMPTDLMASEFYHDYIERRGVTSSMIGGWKFLEKDKANK